MIAQQIGELVEKVPAWWQHVLETGRGRWPQVVEFLNEHPVGQRIRGVIQGQNEALLDGLSGPGRSRNGTVIKGKKIPNA